MIQFTDDIKLVTEARTIEVSNSAGYMLIKFEIVENTLFISREIKLLNQRISKEMYDDFREIMNYWNNDLFRNVIFKQ